MYKKLFKAIVTGVGFTLLFAACTKSTDKPLSVLTQINLKGTSLEADQVNSEMWFSVDGGKTYVPGVMPSTIGQTFQVRVHDNTGDGAFITSDSFTADWSASSPAPSDPTSDAPQFTYNGKNVIKVSFTNKHCAYDASYWTGDWGGDEVGACCGGTDANTITQDTSDPTKFTMDNFWGDGVDAYFIMTPSTSYFDQIVTMPTQVTSEGGTASGTGTYDQCAGTFTLATEYSFPGTDDEIVAIGRGNASGSRLYAATKTAFYFTANAGSSWATQTATGLTPGSVRAITTPHVTADKHVFVATATGVYASADRGATWTAANSGLGSTTNVTALTMIGTTLYATTDGGFFTSADNAATWTASNSGMAPGTSLTSMAISGSDIYVGVDGGGAYHSADGGATWTAIAGDIKNTFTVMAATDTYVFAGSADGFFQSADNGATWTVTNVKVVAMTIQTTSDAVVHIYAGTSDGGVLMTIDNGATWTEMNKGLGSLASVALESATASSSTTNADAIRLFYGTSDGGAFVTTNQGKGWSKVTAGAVYDFQYNFHKP